MLTKTVRVEVTQEDIARGRRSSICECPIAIACQRLSPNSWVGVGFVRRRMAAMFGHEDVALPTEAAEFVSRFDDGKPVQPFTFDIDVPAEALTC